MQMIDFVLKLSPNCLLFSHLRVYLRREKDCQKFRRQENRYFGGICHLITDDCSLFVLWGSDRSSVCFWVSTTPERAIDCDTFYLTVFPIFEGQLAQCLSQIDTSRLLITRLIAHSRRKEVGVFLFYFLEKVPSLVFRCVTFVFLVLYYSLDCFFL